MTTPEVPSNFYDANLLTNNNPDMYHTNHVPYQNLLNGQYAQSHLNSRCLTTSSTFSRGLDTPAFNTERMEMAQNQDLNNSNNESSSDSDDTNNDSDSSIDTDAEKEDRKNSSERVVKPFRINLNKVRQTSFLSFNLTIKSKCVFFFLQIFTIRNISIPEKHAGATELTPC